MHAMSAEHEVMLFLCSAGFTQVNVKSKYSHSQGGSQPSFSETTQLTKLALKAYEGARSHY